MNTEGTVVGFGMKAALELLFVLIKQKSPQTSDCLNSQTSEVVEIVRQHRELKKKKSKTC